MGFGVLVDLTKCIGCRACVTACNHQNNLEAERFDFFVGQEDRTDAFNPPEEGGFMGSATCSDCLVSKSAVSAGSGKRTSHRPNLSANSFTAVEYHLVDNGKEEDDWYSVKRQCMHCLKPSCNAACPVGALHSTPEGAVVYDGYKCIGCRYCMMACPFGVPTYEWNKVAPYIKKCDFCYSRISSSGEEGHQLESACAHACPTGTLQFGERDQLLAEAGRRRMRWPTKYIDHIYGEHDAGGTSWIYLSPIPFEDLGFPGNVGSTAYPDYITSAIDMVPIGVAGSGLALAGLYWLYKRKQELSVEKLAADESAEGAEMTYYRISGNFLTARSGALLALMAAGLIAVVYRFSLGLGPTTGMTDQFPWGIWVGFDVLCGVAVTSGSFTTAAIVYLFFNRSCLGLVRPALLTAFLGYVFVVVGVLFDLGLPWMIWHPIVYWPEKSPMFLVAWCDMLLLVTLGLMFLPAVFERYKLTKLQLLWQNVSSIYVVFSLTLFSYLMSRSLIWAGVTFMIFTFLALVTPRLFVSRPGSPILLLVAAIVFSISHQTALGSLFLLMQDKLDHLWWTPLLPLNFYLSAIPVGMAMVIFESTLSSRSFHLPFEEVPLRIMSRVLLYSLWVYLLVRMIDLIARGHLSGIFTLNGLLFVAEMVVGVLVPLFLFSRKSIVHNVWPRFAAASLVILGLIMNRFNVVMFGMERPGGGIYFPSIEEILITCGIVATFMFFYNVLVRLFPIVEIHDPKAAPGAIVDDADERTIAFSTKDQNNPSLDRTGSEGV